MNADQRIERIEALLEALVADHTFDTKVPLPLRDAALACYVELRTLRDWIERDLIPHYRTCDGAPWRVFPKDVRAYLMTQSSQTPARRQRVLRRA